VAALAKKLQAAIQYGKAILAPLPPRLTIR
jgi:hypothetical protein